MYSPLEQFDVKPLKMLTLNFLYMDLSFFDMFMPMIMMMLTFFCKNYLLDCMTLMPTAIQKWLEDGMEFMMDMLSKQMNNKVLQYGPMMFVLYMMLTLVNMMSMFPMGMSLTSHLMSLLWMSMLMGMACFLYGFWKKGWNFLKMFVPECPLPLMPMLIMMELFSYLMRCFSLAMSLTANMLAGHTLMMMMIVFMISVMMMSFLTGVFSLFFLMSMLMLEMGVCFLQAYVLTMLLCMYMNDMYKEGH